MALAVFCLTFLLIAGARLPFTRLDRPSGALLGAVLMVAFGVVSPHEVYSRAVDFDTLVLLLGMMLITGFLAEARFFERASYLTLRTARTPAGLLWGLCLASGLLSAFFVNDAVCLMFTPLVVQVVFDAELPPLPYLLAVAMGANTGSAATLTGNPQNMLIGQMSHFGYARFVAALALPALVATVGSAAILHLLFRKELPRRTFSVHQALPPVNGPLLAACGVVLLGVWVGFFAGLSMAWTALGGAAALFASSGCEPRRVFARADYLLLVFFAGLFVVVYGVDKAGYAARMLEWASPYFGHTVASQVASFSALTLVASNVFSNVPFVLLAGHWMGRFAEPRTMWAVLALVSTLAGNLTVVGSVANMIVLEMARDRVRVGFLELLRYSVPVTLATGAAALATLMGMRALGVLG